MILSKLDTPFDLPQIMGFLVSSQELKQTREVIKKLVATNDWSEVHQVGILNRKKLNAEIQSYRFSVESQWLNEIIKNLNQVSKKFEFDLNIKLNEFPPGKVFMRPSVFYTLSQFCKSPENLLSASKDEVTDSLKFVYSVRLNELAKILADYDSQELPNYDVPGPFDSTILNFTIPEWPYGDDPTEEEKEFHKRGYLSSQLGSYCLLEKMVGTYASSRGPGPFQELPPSAKKFIDPDWPRHSFFIEEEDSWIVPVHYLVDEDLEKALEWSKALGPRISSDNDLEPSELNTLISNYGNACIQRFQDLLKTAIDSKSAVLLMENDLSHPFWFEGEWPSKTKNRAS